MGVSQAAFEFTIEKMQQTNRRLVIAIIALVVLFAVTVGGMVFAFLKYEEQFNTEYYSVSTDKGGDAIYNSIGDKGDIVWQE
jgi:flagellar basal body-associated protein FliL